MAHTDRIRDDDGIDRRGFLECMAWAGAGVVWTLAGGVLRSHSLSAGPPPGSPAARGAFTFVQVSDSHIGFDKAANKDVAGTFRAALDRIAALPARPDFLIHTGDISHLSLPEQFDTADQILRGAKVPHVFTVPGEHDVLDDGGRGYTARYGRAAQAGGWYSFDHKGVHFVGLSNVQNLKAGGLGRLGPEQLAWLAQDLAGLPASTPIVVFAHIPLWTVYPAWGWGTDDSAQALSHLKRFGSVTVLNGHIHQVMQKVEGNVAFHTATSTAFPQPRPGQAAAPGPMTVPPDRLRGLLGITRVSYVPTHTRLAVVDAPLATAAAAPGGRVAISDFRFTPARLAVAAGAEVTWTNQDEEPHRVVSDDGRFSSPVLDTDGRYTHRFAEAGAYPYYCSLHPHMTGQVVVG